MFVFKLSWLPYILIIGGIGIAVEGQPAALILTVIGGIWLYFRYSNKKSGTTSSAGRPASANNPVNTTPKAVEAVQSVPKTQPAEQAKPAGKFCRHCGAKIEPDDIYCIECGEKL